MKKQSSMRQKSVILSLLANRGITSAGLTSAKRFGLASAGGTDVGKGPQGQVFVLQVPYKHQGGIGARPIDTPNPGSLGPIPDPVDPADVSPPY